mmetsp:Transcript_24466/g.33525  ORF Transcript_24466/g.33525 Transcript_24466/m.33525 type:complete len:206 (+) Transcript_24466:1-618(+)
MEDEIIYSELVDLESSVEASFQSGRTPLIIDTSFDDKVCTFYSYQMDAIILEAKMLIIESSRQPLYNSMEKARRCLVNAMKFGKLLVIRLGTSSPDFRDKYNDENLEKVSNDLVGSNLSFFPKEVFYSGGKELHSELWVKRLFREEDMTPHKNFAICRDTFRVCVTSQLPIDKIDECLFGASEENFGGLPDKSLFKIISIKQDDS